jgi:hypothetical protein
MFHPTVQLNWTANAAGDWSDSSDWGSEVPCYVTVSAPEPPEPVVLAANPDGSGHRRDQFEYGVLTIPATKSMS